MTANLFDVGGRVMVVTGGLGQLGWQFATALADRGARVAIADAGRPSPAAAERLRATPETLRLVTVDVADRQTVEAALARVQADWGVPHGLVNAAAIDAPPDAPPEENGPFETYPVASWERVMRVNVTGTMVCCQVIGGAMAAAGRGSIVNVASIYGMVSPDQRIYEYRRAAGEAFFKPAAYATSKSALLNLTRYLATYWAPRQVRVNTVTFGGVFNNQDPRFLAGYEARVPMGRMARADEYTGAILFLLSEASSYMTGANVVIDGGFTAW